MGYLLLHLEYAWLAAAVLFIIIEAFTFNLTTLWFACGAIIGMACSLAGLPLLFQILLSLLSSITLIVFARPIAVKYLKIGRTKTNSESLIGETGIVVKKIEEFKTGLVKVKGQEWSAESAEGAAIDQGETVVIKEIRGVRLLVNKKGEI
ncbi:MAG: NfeD family protein [Spirochaetia bacterium]|jgi:membrane protein implicated in regulation of membrane protease activity|nr:NfeD family protein [Spirochaetia bacterium]